MKTGGAKRLSRRLFHSTRGGGADCGAVTAGEFMRLLHVIQPVRREMVERLHGSRWPADHGLLDLRILSQTKVKAPVIL